MATSNPACTLCPLHLTALTVCIPGRGRGSTMIVGMNPGAQEDLAGEVFVGRAGRLLDSMLEEAGFDPQAVYITNAVKCHTTRNAVPSTESINACRTYLLEEIHEQKPDVIIALGDVALRALCKRAGLGSVRGTGVALHGDFDYPVEVWPTYHPAYVLRLPQVRSLVVGDLVRVRTRNAASHIVDWEWGTKDKPLQLPAGIIAWDVETSYHDDGKDTVTQIAVAGVGPAVWVVRDLSLAKQLQRRDGLVTVTHNGWKADVPWMRGMGQELPWGEDTIVLAYLDDETQPLALEALCVKYLGVKGWKEGKNAEQGSDEFALYNARDAKYTRDLYSVLCGRLGSRKSISDRIIFPAFLALRECTERGIYISPEAVAHAREHFSAIVRDTVERFKELSPDPGESNPNSPKHVARALQNSGFTLVRTKRGAPRTDIATLSRLPQIPIVKAIREHRKASKAVNAFVVPYERAVASADGRVHPEYKLWRTVTGRTASSGPNVQQLGREPLLRSFFSAPPGYELWSVDYAQIEFRLAAWIAGERAILDKFGDDPDWDPHNWMAAVLYGVLPADVSRTQRQIAKSANFGLLYMAQAETLREYAWKTAGIDLSPAEAERIRKEWHHAYPGFQQWYAHTAESLRGTGMVQSATGRLRHFGRPVDLAGAVFGAALREAVNFQVQSLAADVALLGLAACHEANLPINGFFHDAITFEFPQGTYENESLAEAGGAEPVHGVTAKKIQRLLCSRPIQILMEGFGVDITVPLKVDIKVVSSLK